MPLATGLIFDFRFQIADFGLKVLLISILDARFRGHDRPGPILVPERLACHRVLVFVLPPS